MKKFNEWSKQKFNEDKNYQEAIVDAPSKTLSDIFDPEGKLKPEVVSTITKGIEEIKAQFPNLPIDDYFVVGAAVTYQYSPNSDIDTTISIPRSSDDLFKQANDWIGSNLDPKYKFGSRPYQFKVSKGNRNQIQAFDAVYDIIAQIKTGKPSWIKQPDPNKTSMNFKQFIANAASKENSLYSVVERNIQPSIKRLNELISKSKGVLTDEIKKQMLSVLDRYKIIKKLRSKSYDGPQDPRDQGKISNNWGVGNVVYKFLDREGYLQVFQLIKGVIQSQFQNFSQNINPLQMALSKVTSSSIGYAVDRISENFDNDYNVLIIDVESTCDKNPITNEIIEIGMSDTKGKKFPSIFIKPQNSKVTKFCTDLTTLTQEKLDKIGKTPEEAYHELNKIMSGYKKWASYGDYDRIMLEKMQKLYGIQINMPQHENIRMLFANKVFHSNDDQKAPKNPKDALEILGEKFQGVNHRGDDDAMNIAKVYNIINKM